MAEVEAWIRIILPTIESRLAFQPASFFLNISKMDPKSCLCLPGCFIGKPKYFPKLVVALKPKMLVKASLWLGSTLGEKKTWDFASLTFCPDLLQNSWRTKLMAAQFSGVALAKRTKSSANKRYEKAEPLRDALTRVYNLVAHFSSIKWPKNSMERMKR